VRCVVLTSPAGLLQVLIGGVICVAGAELPEETAYQSQTVCVTSAVPKCFYKVRLWLTATLPVCTTRVRVAGSVGVF
jgi:hypothetical protein